MAGHSKWSNIKHRKEHQDSKKSKLHHKIIKELYIACRNGINIKDNTRLQLSINKAKKHNISKEIINKVLNKTYKNKDSYKNAFLEAYFIKGVCLYIYVLTDNNNRTVAFIRDILNKAGGYLVKPGSLNFLFKNRYFIKLNDFTENKILELLEILYIEIKDYMIVNNNAYLFFADLKQLEKVNEFLIKQNYKIEDNGMQVFPNDFVDLNKEDYNNLEKLIDNLESNDDVVKVICNEKRYI